jgi:hypothetical protein
MSDTSVRLTHHVKGAPYHSEPPAIISVDPNDFIRLVCFLSIALPFYHGAILALTTYKEDSKENKGAIRIPEEKTDLTKFVTVFVHASILFLMSKSIDGLITFVEWIFVFMFYNAASTAYNLGKKKKGYFMEWVLLNALTTVFCVVFLFTFNNMTFDRLSINIGLLLVLIYRTFLDYYLLWNRFYGTVYEFIK